MQIIKFNKRGKRDCNTQNKKNNERRNEKEKETEKMEGRHREKLMKDDIRNTTEKKNYRMVYRNKSQ